MKNEIKAVLFDYDGTVSDRTRSAYANYHALLHEFFPEMDIHSTEFESRIQRCILWDEYGTVSQKSVMKNIREHWKPDLDTDEALKEWYRLFPDHQIWTEGLPAVLKQLSRSYQIGLLTNGPHERQWPKIGKMHLEDYFFPIIVSGDIGIDKPDPRIFAKAAEDMHLRCDECAYVGDTFMTDIAGAVNAGMRPVWYCGERKGITALDIDIIHKAQELLELFPAKP